MKKALLRTNNRYKPQRSALSTAHHFISGVDLFCGVGGLTHGLVRGGIQIAAGVDLDEECRFPYEANNDAAFLPKDIHDLLKDDLLPYFKQGAYKLIAGCAPCQPFSTYNRKRLDDTEDGKWELLLDFGRLVKELQPELVTMENVPQLLQHPVFKQFLLCLTGYHLWYEIVDCVEYGIPQTRKRLVLLASRLGPIALIKPTHRGKKSKTVRSAIFGLPELAAGAADPNDPLHAACSLSQLNLKRVKASKPGGTWRDWPQDLRLKCHKKKSGETYPSVYGRMEWDAPSPTITTQCFGLGNGRFGHPDQDRAITLREAAIIQTFPRQYKFVPNGKKVRFSVLGRLIGNAVPVRLGEVVAKSLKFHIATVHRSAA